MRVRQKIKRLTIRIDEIAAGLAQAKRSGCSLRGEKRCGQNQNRRCQPQQPDERPGLVTTLDADCFGGGCRRDVSAKWRVGHIHDTKRNRPSGRVDFSPLIARCSCRHEATTANGQCPWYAWFFGAVKFTRVPGVNEPLVTTNVVTILLHETDIGSGAAK